MKKSIAVFIITLMLFTVPAAAQEPIGSFGNELPIIVEVVDEEGIAIQPMCNLKPKH